MDVSVRQSPANPDRWWFDFDGAAPGGGGGASIPVDATGSSISVDGVHKNGRMPKRSTGQLLAEGLRQIGMATPKMVECYNVEKSTRSALAAGDDPETTHLGVMVTNLVQALKGTILKWEPVNDGAIYHLRAYIDYP